MTWTVRDAAGWVARLGSNDAICGDLWFPGALDCPCCPLSPRAAWRCRERRSDAGLRLVACGDGLRLGS